METNSSTMDAARQRLFHEVQRQFNETYPYLNLEAVKTEPGERIVPTNDTDSLLAKTLLADQIHLDGHMRVAELESALEQHFGHPVKVLRKSGHTWLETRLTRAWTLHQQNEQGRSIAHGFD
ncbi:MAG: hypothetical protein JST68_29510 [Bacteroidetes bacterium]|nr:hypothetical protein [Bacteroidota bacterium]